MLSNAANPQSKAEVKIAWSISLYADGHVGTL